jgi:hypothetical protein
MDLSTNKMKSYNGKGQVALVMVLIMTVISAVVVSIAGRVTSETNIQRQSNESSDAFLAAQAGLEEALSKKMSVSGVVGTDKSYNVVLDDLGEEGLLTEAIPTGSSVDIVLNASPLLQAIKVYWRSLSNSPSAILVSRITATGIGEFGYSTLGADGFTRINSGGVLSGAEFSYVTPQIALDTTVQRIRITVYGAASFLGIEPIGDLLPIQVISYKAESSVGLGDQKIKYGLQYEESKNVKSPEVFDYALFSMGSIIQ